MSAIGNALRSGEYHVFHYIGHSGFSQGESSLWLESADGAPQAWSGNALGQKLGPHRTLRLAVFNSCEGARQSAEDHFAGIAPSLIRKGIPAVVGMQFAITDQAAILFAESFYETLAKGEPVDRAVWVARNEIHESKNDVEWGTPVLFLRSRDGIIFDRQELDRDATAALAGHAAWYREAKDHIRDGRWGRAKAVLEQLTGERVDYLDAKSMLDDVAARIDNGEVGPRETDAGEGRTDAEEGTRDSGGEPAPLPPWGGWLLAAIITVVIVVVLIGVFSGGS